MDDLTAARRSYRYVLFAVGLLLVALFVDGELSKFSLVTPVPWIVKGPAIGLGMLAGLLLSRRVAKQHEITGRKSSWRDVVGQLAIPLLLAPVGSYVGRRGFETAAFAGGGQPAGVVEAVIAGRGTRRSKVHLEIEPGLRDFWLPIDHRPDVTAIGMFCLEMSVERGRYGALRTTVPTGFDSLHLDEFRPCSPNVLEKNPTLAKRVARIAARNGN